MSSPHWRKLLLLSSEFPPVSNAGVQRPLYFAKYLPHFGWKPLVLTVKDVAHFSHDYTLLDVLPDECSIYRTESLELRRILWKVRRVLQVFRGSSRASKETTSVEPVKAEKAETTEKKAEGARTQEVQVNAGFRDMGRSLRNWFFVPDDRIMWTPFAVPRALRLSRRHKVDAVFATLPTYSVGVTAFIISKLSGLPLVIDMRDPWTGDPYDYGQGPTIFHRRLNQAMERATLRHASKIIVICDSMKQNLLHRYPEFTVDKVVTITNGFDRQEFEKAQPLPKIGKFTVVYAGSLYAHHQPSFSAFCQAWERACDADEEFANEAQFLGVGRCDPEILQEAQRWTRFQAEFPGHQAHAMSIRYLISADLLLLLIKDLKPGPNTVITIPGKVFEYLASGAPIVMIGPEGDAAQLIRSTGAGECWHESDIESISADLLKHYREFRQKGEATSSGISPERLRYDREALASRLAMELDQVINKNGSELANKPA